MDLLNLRKSKKKQKRNIFEDEANERVQLNVVIDRDIKAAVQEMSRNFRLNQSVLTEHLLQVALYYTNITVKDSKKRERIEAHLIGSHLLHKPVDDEEAIILITQPNKNWMLLGHAKHVLAMVGRLRKAMEQVRRTGDFNLAERAEKELTRATLEFADYLLKHRFEGIEDD